MTKCLFVSRLTREFVDAVERLSGNDISLTTCASIDDVLSSYTNETVLVGNPGMIAEVIDRLPSIDWVQSTWAGVTPLTKSRRRDYVLTGLKDVFGPQMAEYTLGYLLAHELKIAKRREAQAAREWLTEYSGTLAGKRLGVMGTGSIGAAIARTAGAFELHVTGLSRSGRAHDAFDEVFATPELRDFLAPLDYLVSTLPNTEPTTNLLNAESLAALPKGAYLVNVGRSNVIDDAALISALENGQLAGAVLDVFDEEPLPEDSALWQAPNLSITAHVAAISHPQLIAPIFVDNYARYVAGKPLKYAVDLSLGY